MLSLFQKIKRFQQGQGKDDIHTYQEPSIDITPRPDADLRKSIANKLQTYQPVERESNFVGPRYYQ